MTTEQMLLNKLYMLREEYTINEMIHGDYGSCRLLPTGIQMCISEFISAHIIDYYSKLKMVKLTENARFSIMRRIIEEDSNA